MRCPLFRCRVSRGSKYPFDSSANFLPCACALCGLVNFCLPVPCWSAFRLICLAPPGEPWRVVGKSFSSVADMRPGNLVGGLGAGGLGQGCPCTRPYAFGNGLKVGPTLRLAGNGYTQDMDCAACFAWCLIETSWSGEGMTSSPCHDAAGKTDVG